MRFIKEGYTSRATLIFLIISIAEYALFHVANLFYFESFGGVLMTVRYYFSEIWSFIMPAAAALLVIIAYAMISTGEAIKVGVMAALSRVGFYLLYYYMMYITEGFDSVESILLSVPTSLGSSLVTFIELSAFALIALLVLNRGAVAAGTTLREYVADGLIIHDLFDVGVPSTLAIGVISLSAFGLRLIFTIINTVIFFVENGKSYTTPEILELLFSYLFALILLIITHLILSFIKRGIIKSRAYTED